MKRVIFLALLFLVPGASAFNYMAVTHVTTPYVSIYEADAEGYTKLTDPGVLPAGAGSDAAFSPDGDFLAVAHSTTPFVTIYSVSGSTFTKLTNPATLPTGTGRGVAFSPDGNFLAVSHSTSPYVTIYSISGSTFTKLTDPATLPAGDGYGVDFAGDSSYMAVSHITTPFVTIYSIFGSTFTKLANPSTLPTGNGLGVDISDDSAYLAVAHDVSPYVTVYSVSGSTFTKLTNPATLPTGAAEDVAFSPESDFLAVAHAVSPRVSIYTLSGSSLTKIANPATLPTGDGYGVRFSPDGNVLSVGHDTTPYVTIYARDETTFTKQADPDTIPTGNARGIAFTDDFSQTGPTQIFCAEPLAVRFGYNFKEGFPYQQPGGDFITDVHNGPKRFESGATSDNRDYLGLGLDKSSRAYEVHFSIVTAAEGRNSIFKAIFSFQDDIPAVGNKGNAVDTGVSANSVRVTMTEQGGDWDVELHSVVDGVSAEDDAVDIGDNPNHEPTINENSFVFVVDTRAGTEEYRIEREDGTVILNAAIPPEFVDETVGSQWFVNQGSNTVLNSFLALDPDSLVTGTSTCLTDLEGVSSVNAPPPSGGGQGGGSDGGVIGDQPFFPGVNTGEFATATGMSLDQVGWLIGLLLILALAAGMAFIMPVLGIVGGLAGLGMSVAFGLIPVWFIIVIVIIGGALVVWFRRG